jgi:HlyD family secretion protein
MTNVLDDAKTTTPTIESPTELPTELPTEPIQPEPKPPSHKWLWILFFTIMIGGLGTGLWYGFLRPTPNRSIQFNGRIEGYETDVSTKGTGRVEEVTVREGATVKKGQLLVRLSDDELRSELRAAVSQVNAARQREATARLQISAAEAQVADAGLNLQQSEGDTTGKVTESEALVATAKAFLTQEEARVGESKALLAQTKVDRDRYALLASQGVETQQRYDLADTTYKTAQAALKSRFAAVEGARQSIGIAQGKLTQARTTRFNPGRQKTNIKRLQTELSQARTLLAVAQADVKTAEANRQFIQDRLNNLTVTSPINGVVTTRSVEPGTVVLPSRPLMRIVDLNQVYMRGFIAGGEVGQIRVGQSARVYLDSDPKHQNPLTAMIAAVDTKASFTPENVYFQKDRVEQVFGVKLRLLKPGGFAKPGMPADAEIGSDR